MDVKQVIADLLADKTDGQTIAGSEQGGCGKVGRQVDDIAGKGVGNGIKGTAGDPGCVGTGGYPVIVAVRSIAGIAAGPLDAQGPGRTLGGLDDMGLKQHLNGGAVQLFHQGHDLGQVVP